MTVTALPAGTILYCGKTEYRILELVSRGGSSFVYQVEQKGQPASALLVKEACPNDEKLALERSGVSIVAHDAAAGEALDACRRMLRSELDLGADIKRIARQVETLYTLLELDKAKLPGKDLAEPCEEGAFALLPDIREQGVFLKDFRSDHRLQLPEIARMLERAVYPVAAMHSIGIVHGDISQNNIFFVWDVLDRSRTAEAVLIDFGCAKRVNADGKTERLDDVLSTQRFAAPELYGKNVQLDLSSDVFSLGCVFLLLLSRLPAENADPALDLRAKKQLRDLVTSDMLRARGGRPEAVRLAKKILRCALDPLPASASDSRRYPNAVKMLKDVQRLTALAQTPACALLNTNLTTTPYWVEGSRDTVLDRLDQELQSGKHPLVLFGDGGSGKTETAIAFGIRQRDRQDDLAREVFFVHYQESMLRTILSLEFSNYSGVPEGTPDRERAEFRKRLEIIRNAYENALFIFDNFDSETEQYADLVEEPAFQAVGKLPIKILLTTRFRPDNITPELEQMQVADLVTLFCSAAGMERQPEDGSQMREDIVALILQGERHPLTVELLGAAIAESDSTLTVAMLRQKMERGDAFDDAGLPEVPAQRVHGDWRSAREQRIYAHLKQVFDVSEMNEQQKTVLCCASLLGPAGMDEALFKTCCGSGNAYKRLKKRCWLKVKGGTVTIHPLIREVALRELAPCLEICKPFLDGLWNEYDQREWGKKWDPKQMLPVFVNAHRLFSQNDLHADNAYRAAHIMQFCSVQYDEAQILAEYAAEKCVKIGDYAGAAAGYRLLCENYRIRHDDTMAERYAVKAFESDCKCDPLDLCALANNYQSLAQVYDAFSAYEAALIVSATALYLAAPALQENQTETGLPDLVIRALKNDTSDLTRLLRMEKRIPIHPGSETAGKDALTLELQKAAMLGTYLRILDDLPNIVHDHAPRKEIRAFLTDFHNYCVHRDSFTHLSAEQKIKMLSRVVSVTKECVPGRSCVIEWVNIGLYWDDVASETVDKKRKKEALDQSALFSLRALREAETTQHKEELIASLAAVVNALLNLRDYELENNDDRKKAAFLAETAYRHALRALAESSSFPQEPDTLRDVRRRLRRAGKNLAEWTESKHDLQSDADPIKIVFLTTEEDIDWYNERELRIARKQRYAERASALRQYELRCYIFLGDPVLRGLYFTNLKERTEALEKQMVESPDGVFLFPYHVTAYWGDARRGYENGCVFEKRVVKNAIQCRICKDVLTSSDGLISSNVRTCSCGACGIEGGKFALIRYTRTPAHDDYEELSVIETTEVVQWPPEAT